MQETPRKTVVSVLTVLTINISVALAFHEHCVYRNYAVILSFVDPGPTSVAAAIICSLVIS